MNDKDLKEFDKWVWDNFNLTYDLNPLQYDDLKESWQAACEYKQKEIEGLNSHVKFQSEVMCDMGEVVLENKKLQAENAKLRECVEFYADENNWIKPYIPKTEHYQVKYKYHKTGGKRARQVLKELGNK